MNRLKAVWGGIQVGYAAYKLCHIETIDKGVEGVKYMIYNRPTPK